MPSALASLATSAAAVGLAAGGCAYAAMWPESQIFGRTLLAGHDPAEFALTYDDGPNDPWTLRLLERLARHSIHATFFLIGGFVRRRPDVAREIRAAGHLVANHTLSHPFLPFLSPRRVREELAACNAAIEDALGEAVRFFRPPHGARRPDILRTARSLGLTPVLWNAAGSDWNPISPEEIAARLTRGIRRNRQRGRGTNLLLHDGGHTAMGVDRSRSLAATELILARYSPGETRYVTVDRWV
jgi:peptidoglycan/xylan/chitin deacetylase (PgdA/CDA1 family)